MPFSGHSSRQLKQPVLVDRVSCVAMLSHLLIQRAGNELLSLGHQVCDTVGCNRRILVSWFVEELDKLMFRVRCFFFVTRLSSVRESAGS